MSTGPRWCRNPIGVVVAISHFLGLGSVGVSGAELAKEQEARRALAKHCFPCHGPDASSRKADLRLDLREMAVAPRDEGALAIDPGSPQTSVVLQRITTTDPDDRMPPPDSGPAMSAAEIEAIRAWIDSGAPYTGHWAFETPERPAIPKTTNTDWAVNPIDQFILAAMEARGLEPNPVAPVEKRARRARLALTGLTALDGGGISNELLWREDVLEAMDSEQFGEHQARYWLDAARYGDTHGLHLDNERAIWPYRDWVVNAFNQNQPFDQFVIEQIAGDLLPNPERSQLVATGFNRCNVTTSEGGAIPQEFAVRYAVDRVNTMGTVFMGMTVGCAQCHDHKFDPLTQREYYQFFAIYNNLDENPMDGNSLTPPPTIPLPSPEQEARLADLDRRVAEAQSEIERQLAALELPEGSVEPVDLEPVSTVWVEDGAPRGTKVAGNAQAGSWVGEDGGPVYSGKSAWRQSAEGLTQIVFQEAKEGLWIDEEAVLFAHVYLDPDNPPETVMLQYNDGSWDHRAYWGADKIVYGQGDTPGHRHIGTLPEAGRWVRLEARAQHLGLAPGAKINGIAFTQFGGTATWDAAGIVSALPQAGAGWRSFERWLAFQKRTEGRDLPEPLRGTLASEEVAPELQEHFLKTAYAPGRALVEPLETAIAALKAEKETVRKSIPVTMITRELAEPRKTTILERGEYDKPGEEVTAGFPEFLGSVGYQALNGAPNRLDLARWLVEPTHPLTARVLVNRIWAQVFGRGLVETVDDFGTQGAPPSHPQLLDWLAVEWVESGWDTKRLLWLMVSSATFNQSSDRVAGKLAIDPENRFYSMGPRFRLDAEVLRDNALAVSELLSYRVGGHGVRPYQPEGLWRAVGYPSSNTARFRQDAGEALYRRSLYTFIKRTSAPPSMTIFDAPNRESCVVLRERTNTPLQALVSMNDPQFVEAARHFGDWMRRGDGDLSTRMAAGFHRVTARRPNADEQSTLLDTFEGLRQRYLADPEAARRLLAVGDSPETAGGEAANLAAWTMLGNLLLNLDETLTLN